MLVFLYYILLFFLQIYMLIKIMRNKRNYTFSKLMTVLLTSIFCLFLNFIYFALFEGKLRVNLGTYFYQFIVFCVYFTMWFFISICYIIKQKKNKKYNIEEEDIEIKYKKRKYFLIILALFVIIMTIDTIIMRFNIISEQNTIKVYIEDYLNNKYGDGNFEIISIRETGGLLSSYTHELTVKTSYFEEKFIIKFDKDEFKVEKDEFYNYYNKKQEIN